MSGVSRISTFPPGGETRALYGRRDAQRHEFSNRLTTAFSAAFLTSAGGLRKLGGSMAEPKENVFMEKIVYCRSTPKEIIQSIQDNGYEGCLECQRRNP